jgi:hypothetical protein
MGVRRDIPLLYRGAGVTAPVNSHPIRSKPTNFSSSGPLHLVLMFEFLGQDLIFSRRILIARTVVVDDVSCG